MSTSTTALNRCADCQHNPGTGRYCPLGKRYSRGRTRLKCASFERVALPSIRVAWHGFVIQESRGRFNLVRVFVEPRLS